MYNQDDIDQFKSRINDLIEILNYLKILIFEIDYNGTYLYIAPTSLKLLAEAKEKIIGKSFFDIFPEQTAKFFLKYVQDSIKNNKINEIKYPLTIEEVEYWFEALIIPKNKNKVLFVVREIIKEKKIEDELAETKTKYFTLFEYANDAIFLIKEYVFKDCNSKALEMFKCKREDIIEKSPIDFSPEYQDGKILSKELALKKMDIVLKGIPQIFEWKHKTKNGHIFDTEVSLTKVKLQNSDYILAIVRDITMRKKIENDLKESEEYARTLFENTDIPLVIMDPETFEYLDCNMAAVKIYGCKTREEVIGKTPAYFSTEYQPDGSLSEELAKKIVKEVLKKGSIYFEWRHKRKDGKEWFGEIHLMCIKYRNKKILQFSLKDITEKKIIENEQIKLAKLESISVVVGGIAHDFNNILSGVFGNVNLAEMELEQGHPAIEYIKNAKIAYERAKDLTKRLLMFSKGQEPVINNVNITSLIKEVVEFTLSGSNIKPVLKINKNLWNIEADRNQLSDVISNLIINAKQAMPEGGKIYIYGENVYYDDLDISFIYKGRKIFLKGRNSKKFIKIQIVDEGYGIPEDVIDKIFDPYFTTKKEGNGLGLSIVHKIITNHGGFIKVSSIVNKGTTFTIFLPAVSKSKKKETKNKGIDKKAKINKNDNVNNNKIKDSKTLDVKEENKINDIFLNKEVNILFVDDNEIVRNTAKLLIEKMDFKVVVSDNGENAVEIYKSAYQKNKKFDIVILDLTIRGGEGAEKIVKKILKIDKDAKVIVSSGYSEDKVVKNYKEYGFSGKLIKPFVFETLKEEIVNVLKK